MFKISILWGAFPEPGDKPKTYEFANKGELHAFQLALEESEGWLGHQEVEEDFVFQESTDD